MLRVLNQRNQPVEIYLDGTTHHIPPQGELVLNLDEKSRETLCSLGERLQLHIEPVVSEPAPKGERSTRGASASKKTAPAGKKPKRRKKHGV